ncbi:hypothetical protein JMJ35_010415 [Cladonia borealis]|uniref:Phosphoglycerate mutase n=1 Tax=Cladonia borealis TaxID=184061 RepID=A0AA39QQM9_9LECA|nr:hypothetical protein JMJ35_010415 [Cladonia borealis]
MTTPRAFIIRHGETEWSLNGRHTGTTDIPLTANGEKRIRATGKALVGDDRLIVPSKLAHIYVSPRHRARRTLELLDLGCKDKFLWQEKHQNPLDIRTNASVQITPDIREWDYGDYEGITSSEIAARRKENGVEGKWDIWRDGCPGGESPQQVTERVDRVIRDIRSRFHEGCLGKNDKGKGGCGDVLLVAHGHILRAFAMRWIGRELTEGVGLILEAGGVGTLSYEHHSVNEPAILLGGAFMVDLVENAEEKEKGKVKET